MLHHTSQPASWKFDGAVASQKFLIIFLRNVAERGMVEMNYMSILCGRYLVIVTLQQHHLFHI